MPSLLPEELIVGNPYIIDKGFANSSKVILVHSYGKLFCRVKSTDDDYEWDTMLNRLSKIEQNVPEPKKD